MQQKSLSDIKSIHFTGVCGTAMGSAAVMFREQGFKVTGSDANIYPPMSTFLETNGIKISEGYTEENVDHKPDLVVIGNAISRGNVELEAVMDNRLFYLSLPETLRLFFLRHTHNLIVSGTHGKTTTTSMLAWIFEASGRKPSYLIGGVPQNLSQSCKQQEGDHWILEGDEYDTAFFDKRSKFLHYLPELVIINNLEFDHADIYDSLDQIKLSFRRLVSIVPRNGMLVLNADDQNVYDVAKDAQAQLVEVGFSENAAIRITECHADNDGTSFRFMDHHFELHMHGSHNVHNACMAIAAAHFYGITLEEIAKGISTFKGVKRRMEIRSEAKGITVIDDFAHHPTAIKETLQALNQKYKGRKIWALFEPRSNTTRRSIFQNDLPESLSHADGVFIGKVSRMDQLPEEQRLSPEKIVQTLKKTGTSATYEENVDKLIATLTPQLQDGDIVAVLSNGNFDGLIPKLIKQIEAMP